MFPRLGLVLVVSTLVGLLVAGLAFPVVGGLGLMARAGAESFDDLPAELEAPSLPQRSRILAADGETVLATIFLNQNRVVVPLSSVPRHVRQALISIEDRRFYQHNGVDYQGILRALITNTRAGEVEQGASSLTQQYVKNVLLTKAATEAQQEAAVEETLGRKLREARYALALEERLSKSEILERYLNIALFGNGVYGIGTAAQYYFSKPVSQLTLAEGAMLAGMVKNPTRYDPTRDPETAKARRNTVLAVMADVGAITEERADQAQATPLGLNVNPTKNGCNGSQAPFFCEWILTQAQRNPAFGETSEERVRRLFQGGLTIRTTLDPQIQAASQHAVDSTIPRDSRVATASVVIEPGTGHVKAMAVNRGFGTDPTETKVNLATGGSTGYQAGSTFKAFTLAAALAEGIPLSTTIYAPEEYVSPIFKEPKSGAYHNAVPGESGYYTISEATWLSVNTFYIRLEERVGVPEVAHMAAELGVKGLPFDEITDEEGSFTLGTREVSPLEMANAYATFAAHGMRCQPRGIQSVRGPDGRLVATPTDQCERVIPAPIADTVTSVLEGVIKHGTGQSAAIGRPAAGKTGTTESFGAAWFVGYTPQLSTAAWVGDPRGPSHALIDVLGYNQVYGAGLPATVWRKTMSRALEGVPPQSFAGRDISIVRGEETEVPEVRGRTVEQASSLLHQAGFGVKIAEERVYDETVPTGLVAASNPASGTEASKGSTVTLLLSTGTSSSGPATETEESTSPSPSVSPTPSTSTSPSPSVSPTPSTSTSPSPSISPTPSTSTSPSPSISPSPSTTPGGGGSNGNGSNGDSDDGSGPGGGSGGRSGQDSSKNERAAAPRAPGPA